MNSYFEEFSSSVLIVQYDDLNTLIIQIPLQGLDKMTKSRSINPDIVSNIRVAWLTTT